jgi:hypothetical protein
MQVSNARVIEADLLRAERDALAAQVVVLRDALGSTVEAVMDETSDWSYDPRSHVARRALALTLPEAAKRVAAWEADSGLLHWLMESHDNTGIRVGWLLHNWDCEGSFLDYCRAQFKAVKEYKKP